MSDSNGHIPIFTPPSDQSKPSAAPARQPHERGCHHHPELPAVGSCARCHNDICEDCAEVYTLAAGEYANQSLCFNCCKGLVAENVVVLQKQKTKIITTFVLTLIGVIFGAILFSGSSAFGVIFGMLWVGSFWVWVKNSFSGWWNDPNGRSLGGFIGSCLGSAIIAPFHTIIKIINCIRYLISTSKFIEEDQAALRSIEDYMQYTLVRSRNAGIDLESLINQHSALHGNSFVQSIKNIGESAAEANLRNSAARIASNGEIIRGFAA